MQLPASIDMLVHPAAALRNEDCDLLSNRLFLSLPVASSKLKEKEDSFLFAISFSKAFSVNSSWRSSAPANWEIAKSQPSSKGDTSPAAGAKVCPESLSSAVSENHVQTLAPCCCCMTRGTASTNLLASSLSSFLKTSFVFIPTSSAPKISLFPFSVVVALLLDQGIYFLLRAVHDLGL